MLIRLQARCRQNAEAELPQHGGKQIGLDGEAGCQAGGQRRRPIAGAKSQLPGDLLGYIQAQQDGPGLHPSGSGAEFRRPPRLVRGDGHQGVVRQFGCRHAA